MEGTSWQHTILKNAFVEFYEQETVWMQYKLDIQVKLYTCSYKVLSTSLHKIITDVMDV